MSPVNADLMPLADNGGSTMTHALTLGSLAADNGDTTQLFDQRGRPRNTSSTDGNCDGSNQADIGAFEKSIYAVTNTLDSGSGSLREAITTNNLVPRDAVCVSASGTINLLSPLPVISQSLNLEGPGAALLEVRRDDNAAELPVFTITADSAAFSGVTIANGKTTGSGGGIQNSSGELSLTDCAVTENEAATGGGVSTSGRLTVLRCSFVGNRATEAAGAISSAMNVALTESTIRDNESPQAAAIQFHGGRVFLVRCTVSGNVGQTSPDISTSAIPLVLRNCTVMASNAGAIESVDANAAVVLGNTIVASVGAGPSLTGAGVWGTIGGNLIENNSSISDYPVGLPNTNGDFVGSQDDPLSVALLPLGNYGGPTFTHALSSFSPAIDAGIDAFASELDQRGEPRSDGDDDGTVVADIGAFEATKESLSAAGTVHAGSGFVTDILTMNGSAGGADRCVTVPVDTSITVDLTEAPAGSGTGRYIFYAWVGLPTTPTAIDAAGVRLGCLVNAAPIGMTSGTSPFRCLRSAGIPSAVCRGVREINGPSSLPWMLTKAGGLGNPAVFTLQAIVEDNGSAHPTGFSISNAVTLKVE